MSHLETCFLMRNVGGWRSCLRSEFWSRLLTQQGGETEPEELTRDPESNTNNARLPSRQLLNFTASPMNGYFLPLPWFGCHFWRYVFWCEMGEAGAPVTGFCPMRLVQLVQGGEPEPNNKNAWLPSRQLLNRRINNYNVNTFPSRSVMSIKDKKQTVWFIL